MLSASMNSVRTDIFPWDLKQDLAFICNAVGDSWHQVRNAKIFITGGTGFIGRWLLESLRYANTQLNLNIQATILTRDSSAFHHKAPHLVDYSAFTFLTGDVRNFALPAQRYTHLIHAATDASAELNENDPRCMFDTIIQGTRHVLDFAVEHSARVLFLSSGAVYGQQPWELEHVPEHWHGAPNCLDSRSAYAEGKRAAEMLCAIYSKQFNMNISIARIFALLGPCMPLDSHFAVGNFIRDAMQGKMITVNGNGLPCRSYLYAADLTVWLWKMLVHARSGKAYNVGSDQSVSIKELAAAVARVIGNGEYRVLGADDKGWNLGRYVPDINAIKKDLGVTITVGLDEAIRRTALWNGWKDVEQ